MNANEGEPGEGKRQKGWNWTMMFVGVAVIIVVAALMLPGLNAAREKARRAGCLQNLKQIECSLLLYSGDNMHRYPCDANATAIGSFALLTNQYQVSYRIWVCYSDIGVWLGDRGPSRSFTSVNCSYAYNPGYGETTQPDTPIVADRTSTFGTAPGQAWAAGNTTPYSANKWTHKSDGGFVLFVDGHIAFQKTWGVPPYANWRNP